MTALVTAGLVSFILLGAVLSGAAIRRLLPDNHLSPDSKDAVKLAMSLVATMTALILGLLVSSAKESFEAFRELATRFPDSRYTPDARARMTYIVNSLAQYEVHVARYYYSRGAYVAAISRAQSAVTDYREVPAIEEALYILMRSYDALGMTQLRDDTRRVLEKSYPQSAYLQGGFRPPQQPWWKFW